MNRIPFQEVEVKNGFWYQKQKMVKNVTLQAVYDRFVETHRFEALRCEWKEGDPNMPHIFWDSDVAKWIEAAAYQLLKERNEELEKIIDEYVDLIIKNSDEHGYFNSHFLVNHNNKRFTIRSSHELYCAGHLMEAAAAYEQATGKSAFLDAMCRYADYIDKVFRIEKSAEFVTPGHPEIELALVKLYHATKNERYLTLSKFFIDNHGTNKADLNAFDGCFNNYNQDEIPLRERNTADGHSVRALYLLCGAADIGEIFKDNELVEMCRRLFDNIAKKRMYITGGVGSTSIGETFTIDYDLPNRTAYAETCAAISLAMFAGRMQAIEPDGKYADVFERAIYNGVLSGVSMDGKSFFYENPLEIDLNFNQVNPATKEKQRFAITQRQEVFECSCCPPNIARFIPSVADYLYSYNEDTLFIHQYMESSTTHDGMTIHQITDYPSSGAVTIKCEAGSKTVALRIPGWCKSYRIDQPYELKNGYVYIDAKNASEINVIFDMPVTVMRALMWFLY